MSIFLNRTAPTKRPESGLTAPVANKATQHQTSNPIGSHLQNCSNKALPFSQTKGLMKFFKKIADIFHPRTQSAKETQAETVKLKSIIYYDTEAMPDAQKAKLISDAEKRLGQEMEKLDLAGGFRKDFVYAQQSIEAALAALYSDIKDQCGERPGSQLFLQKMADTLINMHPQWQSAQEKDNNFKIPGTGMLAHANWLRDSMFKAYPGLLNDNAAKITLKQSMTDTAINGINQAANTLNTELHSENNLSAMTHFVQAKGDMKTLDALLNINLTEVRKTLQKETDNFISGT